MIKTAVKRYLPLMTLMLLLAIVVGLLPSKDSLEVPVLFGEQSSKAVEPIKVVVADTMEIRKN